MTILCKYFLSIIDQKYLSNFIKTIEWLNGNLEIQDLPMVAERISYHSFSHQPKLTYYLRKNDDKNIPYAIGEFYFACTVMVFIIPFTEQDNKTFTNKIDFDNFWQTFKHLSKLEGWIFSDFSSNEAKEFNITLNFEIKNKKTFPN